MIWIIPIAGRGTRVKSLGEFKPFIEIKGHKMLTWAIVSIKHHVKPQDTFGFITTKEYESKHHVQDEIKTIFKEFRLDNKLEFFIAPETPPGPLASIYLAKTLIDTSEPVTIINEDQYTDFEFPRKIPPQSVFLTTVADFGQRFGYIEIKEGLIKRFLTRKNISNLASAGVYIFSKGKDFLEAIEKTLGANVTFNGEFRLEDSINFLIDKGYRAIPIPVACFYVLGDLEGISFFSSSPVSESLSKTILKEM